MWGDKMGKHLLGMERGKGVWRTEQRWDPSS